MTKTLSVLGVTGSIGQSTLRVVDSHPDMFSIVAVTANTKARELANIAKKYNAQYAVIAQESEYALLKELLATTDIKVRCGEEGLLEAAAQPADITMAAIMGMAGLLPTLKAIEQGNTVAFATKEALVGAGSLMMQAVNEFGTTFLPVDSEHNAIFQVLQGKDDVKRLILTASGGPFRNWSVADMVKATPEQAVAHPNWTMGAKISVDSATLMNKGLELIEACYLFDFPESNIDILIHPQSIVHSMVEYHDGSVLAQLGAHDMCTPITYSLGYPKRIQTPGETLNFEHFSQLNFESPQLDKFPALNIAREAMKSGQSACIILNAANEMAVEAFLGKRIGFGDIVRIINIALEEMRLPNPQSIQEVVEIDSEVRKFVKTLLKEKMKDQIRA